MRHPVGEPPLSIPTTIQTPNQSDFHPEQNVSLPAPIPWPIVELYRLVVPVLLAACLLSCLSNVLIVCSARWIRRRRLTPNLLLCLSLAAADAFASLVVGLGLLLNSFLPVALSIRLDEGFNCWLLAIEALRLGSLVSTALHLLALAVNHHVGIAQPLHYSHLVTRRTTSLSVAAIWLAPVAFFFVFFSAVGDDGFRSPRCSSHRFLAYSPFRLTVAVLFFIPLAAMLFFYGHIYAIVRGHRPPSNASSDRLFRRKVKATVTTLLILGAYVVGWMPAVLYFVLTCVDCPLPFLDIPMDVRVPVGLVTNALVVGRCLADPALYLVRMPEVRDALRTMVGLSTASSGNGLSSQTDARRMTLLSSQRNGLVVTGLGRML